MRFMKPIIKYLGAGKFIMIGNTIYFMILLISFDFTTFLIDYLISGSELFQKINDFNQKMCN